MKRLAIALLALAALTLPAAAQDTLTGTVTHVRDGDTIEVAGVPVRLNGVAPQRFAFARSGRWVV